MTVAVISRTLHIKGTLFIFEKSGKQYEILFTTHALERIKKWRLNIEMTAETLLSPEEVLVGHNKRFVAHRCFGQHLVRAVYEYDNFVPVLITVYFPYKNRYFKGGGSIEDKILPSD